MALQASAGVGRLTAARYCVASTPNLKIEKIFIGRSDGSFGLIETNFEPAERINRARSGRKVRGKWRACAADGSSKWPPEPRPAAMVGWRRLNEREAWPLRSLSPR